MGVDHQLLHKKRSGDSASAAEIGIERRPSTERTGLGANRAPTGSHQIKGTPDKSHRTELTLSIDSPRHDNIKNMEVYVHNTLAMILFYNDNALPTAYNVYGSKLKYTRQGHKS